MAAYQRRQNVPTAPRFTRVEPSLRGPVEFGLWSQDGGHGILRVTNQPTPGGTGELRYEVQTAGAVAEFGRMAVEPTDFGGERDFTDWVNYVFTARPDVRLMF